MTKYLNAEIFTFLFGKTASFFFCLFEDPFFYFVIFLLVISNSLEAQDRLELIHADFSRGQMSGQKEEVKILEGSVHVRQDTVEIFCDRALYYRGEGKLILEGHVRLIRGRTCEINPRKRNTDRQKGDLLRKSQISDCGAECAGKTSRSGNAFRIPGILL
jgi:hypothetical protein